MDSEEENDSCNSSGDDDLVFEAAAKDSCHHHHYTILTEETIKQLLQNDVSEVSTVLSVSRGIACSLLLHKSWNVSSILEHWFTDEEGLREAIGISRKQIPPKVENLCKICFENFHVETMLSAGCGHLFCSGCWKAYLAVSVNSGPGCLTLPCPQPEKPNCKAFADLDMVESLATDDDKQTYYRYLYRSYVELSSNRKWCPAPGCDLAVEFDDVGDGESSEVRCDCSYKFCGNCGEESHRPVACTTVAKWMEKNSSEADNTAWFMAFTKPCPKCKNKIEKNHGCNHMTCRKPCGYEFCWLCLGVWVSYSHRCNKFDLEMAAAEESSLEDSRKELKRYSHYFERWLSNQRSRNIALADLARVRAYHIPRLYQQTKDVGLDLEFVVEAWDQIVECRRVLRWSYAYGYYVEKGKKTFFECLQGEAEAALERLHHCAEKEMKKYVKAEAALDDFGEFCRKLKTLTCVTKNYFENLVGAFENGLCEVESSSSTPSRKKHKA